MAQNLLRKVYPSLKKLDDMIFKLETNLGRQHSVSPFAPVYQQYNFSTTVQTAQAEESKKEEVKKQLEAEKAKKVENK
jgi:hypothetical protein